MKEYTFSEARQRLASLLDRARKEGAARIRKRNGQKFILQPERQSRSPLDVPGLNLENRKRRDIGNHTVEQARILKRVKANKSLQQTPKVSTKTAGVGGNSAAAMLMRRSR